MITVTLTFSESDIKNICTSINSGDEALGKELFGRLKKDPELLARFTAELRDTPFTDELVEGSEDACANDWLCDFSLEDDDSDEGDY